MLLYLSGPIAGKPDANRALFAEVAAAMRGYGHAVISPTDNFGGDASHDRATYMRVDIGQVLAADGIVMLPEWKYSRGAMTEYLVAIETGKRTFAATARHNGEQVIWTLADLPAVDWSTCGLRYGLDRNFWSMRFEFKVDSLASSELRDFVESSTL